MGSDRARRSYDAGRMYRSVVSQQGRVTVEADANEAEEIRTEESRGELIDITGPTGTPDDGFKISVPSGTPDQFDFAIGKGVLYVGGVRVQSAEPQATYLGQKRTEWIDYPAGRPAAYPTNTAAFSEAIYLAVTEQEVCAVEDEALREVALGGPDTAARTRLNQRVQRMPFAGSGCTEAFQEVLNKVYPSGVAYNSATMRLDSTMRLRVDFVPDTTPADICQPTAQTGFLGPENQLIRVQVTGDNRMLWGWDNASFLYRVTIKSATTIRLEGVPVDVYHQPSASQWVEVLGTAVDLGNGARIASPVGIVRQVDAYDPTERSMALKTALPTDFVSQPPLQVFLRVWENQLAFAANENTATELVASNGTGTGVRVYTKGATPVPGDYWMIGMRPSTPHAILPARLAEFQLPDGPPRWLVPLAVIAWHNDLTTADVTDCRRKFDNLVELSKRQSGASCCTVLVKSTDLNATTTLQSILDKLKNTQSTVCLQPGEYLLSQPLVLGKEHSGLTIEGCHADVVLQSMTPAKAFLHGLVILNGADDITLRGLRFELPDMPFLGSGGVLADIPIEMLRGTVEMKLESLHTAIGVRVLECTNLRLEDCTFNFQNPSVSAFEAGVFAIGECQGLRLKDNQFTYAAGQPLESKAEVRIGYLMTPAISKVSQINKSIVDGAQVVPAFLDSAAICGNTFSGLSAAVLIYGEVGNLRIEANTVRACYSGFNLFALRFNRSDEALDQSFWTFSRAWLDLPFALGGAIAQGFPVPKQFKARVQLTAKGKWTKPTLPVNLNPMLVGGFGLDSVFATVNKNTLEQLRNRRKASVIATQNEIEAVVSAGPSGSAFVFWGDLDASAQLVLSANSMRGQPADNIPVAAVMRGVRGAVTGNLILHLGRQFSLVVLPTPSADVVGAWVAITGNTLSAVLTPSGLTPLIEHKVPPFERWDPLNLFVTP